MKARETIVKKALKLFNEKGVNVISTNHIADAMKISPGNLYYHFQNKQEIIREIYHSMIRYMDAVWVIPSSGDGEVHLIDYMTKTMKMQYRFRFFYREIGTLLNSDEKLRQLYAKNRRNRQSQMLQLFEYLHDTGFVCLPACEEERRMLIGMIWNHSEWWLAYDICDQPKSLSPLIRKNMRMILFFLRPYIIANLDWPIKE